MARAEPAAAQNSIQQSMNGANHKVALQDSPKQTTQISSIAGNSNRKPVIAGRPVNNQIPYPSLSAGQNRHVGNQQKKLPLRTSRQGAPPDL